MSAAGAGSRLGSIQCKAVDLLDDRDDRSRLTRRRSDRVAQFKLQFEIREVASIAARFPGAGDAEALAIGRAVRVRGYYTRAEFRTVCRWKTPRSGPLVVTNTAPQVKRATAIALADGTDERERMRALRELRGVNWATASVILHLADPDRYPILDVRALDALGIRGRTSYGYEFWVQYVEAFRELVIEAEVDGRTLDRALWQWSAEN
jgi:hypothetical protein